MDKEPLDFGLNDDTWNATTEDIPVQQVEALVVKAYERGAKEATEDMDAAIKFAVENRTKELMQLFLDPENQPTQFGTATLEYREMELSKAAPVRTKNLTDEEIYDVCKDVPFVVIGPDYDLAIARAVIAADREKNK